MWKEPGLVLCGHHTVAGDPADCLVFEAWKRGAACNPRSEK